MKCKLNKPEVHYYNASILVNTQYGRSLTSPSIFYVSPFDTLYNYETHASKLNKSFLIKNGLIFNIIEIESVSPQAGSESGGTYVTINGQYFYDSVEVPSKIAVDGQPCKLISFDMTNLPDTVLVCQTSSEPSTAQNEYYGNRGITVIRDNVFTTNSSLATALPSANAVTSIASLANYTDTQTVDVTIWMKGFISPARTSLYEFSLVTNADAAVLYGSTDETSANQVNRIYSIIKTC